jgi:hypothetical protein
LLWRSNYQSYNPVEYSLGPKYDVFLDCVRALKWITHQRYKRGKQNFSMWDKLLKWLRRLFKVKAGVASWQNSPQKVAGRKEETFFSNLDKNGKELANKSYLWFKPSWKPADSVFWGKRGRT